MKRISNVKRKYFKRAASFLAVACCLAGACIPGKPGDGVLAAPRIVFENEEKMSPDLYVVKETESAVEGYEIPENLRDKEFTFKLTVDKEPKETSFTLYQCQEGNGAQEEQGEGLLQKLAGLFTGRSGTDTAAPEAISYEGKIYLQQPDSSANRTNANGEFSLKAGQMAKFYIGNKKEYKVEEVVCDENFRLDRTENASGTMGKNGKFARFVNQWIPDEPGGTTTRLQVKKTVTFPDGYRLPFDNPAFLFRLETFGEMGYEPCAGMSYDRLDSDGNPDTSGMMFSTDDNGFFTLPGGYTAEFQDIPTGKEYRVTEVLKESDAPGEEEWLADNFSWSLGQFESRNWRSTTEQVQTVITTAPLTQTVFNNINASFLVSKELESREGKDDSSFRDTKFTFLLTKQEGEKNSQWGDVPYYLYDTATGEQIEPWWDEDEVSWNIDLETGLPRTLSDGTFFLKPGQTAIFCGIAPGTVYGVKEEAQTGFRQTLPRELDYYTGQTVQEDEPNLHPFTNEVRDLGMLTVTKRLVNAKGEAPMPDDKSFTFELKKKGDDGAYAAVPDTTVYRVSVGGQTQTHHTEGGRFTLKNGETAEFAFSKDFTPGDYTVQEITENFPPGYWFNRVEWIVRGGSSNDTDAESAIRDAGIGIRRADSDASESGESQVRDADSSINTKLRGIQIGGGNKEPVIITEAGMMSQRVNNPIEIPLAEEGADVVYYNNYAPDRTDIVLTKMDNTVVDSAIPGKGKPLGGAEFRLYRVETVPVPGTSGSGEGSGETTTVETEVEADKIYTTASDGTLRIDNLSSGTYRLKETKAPDGYVLMDAIEIVIDRKGKSDGVAEITVSVNGKPIPTDNLRLDVSRKDPNRLPCTAQFIPGVSSADNDSALEMLSLNQAGGNQAAPAADDQLILYAYDDFLYTLPSSGGIGIYWYLIGGVLLMMAASLILYKDKLKYAGRLR